MFIYGIEGERIMNPLTIDETITMVALADNNFIVGNAAIDLNVSGGAVARRVTKIMNGDTELFTYRALPDNPTCRKRITGFTDNGYRFYSAAKYFIDSLSEI